MLRLCLLDVCVFSFDVICFLVLCVIYFNNVPEDLTNETAVEHFICCFIYKKVEFKGKSGSTLGVPPPNGPPT